MNGNIIRQSLQTILESYTQARNNQAFAGHTLRGVFETIKGAICSLPAIATNPKFIVKWSIGKGNWARVPWIALLDERETDTTQHGVYCVYLFCQDMSGVYLTFNQGVTQLIDSKGRVGAYAALRARAQELRPMCAPLLERGFKITETIDLKAEPGLGSDYEQSTIAHKYYEAGNLPDDQTLTADLEALVSVYKNHLIGEIDQPPVKHEAFRELNTFISSLTVVANSPEIALRIGDVLAIRLVAAVLSKRFLILTGLAGSGKTKLAQALAHWLTPKLDLADPAAPGKVKSANPFHKVVPVGADWSGSENILGYPDGLQVTNYVAKPALELILHAADHAGVPHFLILDEMNLSHVERYFADILSVIESNEGLDLYSGDMTKPETWRKTSGAKAVPPKLNQLPENLYIIGTVNVDETTYMFSPKVLDRANVIEFRMDAAELESFLGNPAKPDLSKLDGKGASFGKAFVAAAKDPVVVPPEVKADYEAEMLLLFKTLQPHGAEFGYRTAYESARFIHFYKLLGNHADDDVTWFSGAFDCMVFQKLLPKLHGSRAKLGPVLKKLWFLCVNDAAGRGTDPLMAAEVAARSTDKTAEPSVVIPDGAPYRLSAEKISRMWRLLIENGFASFAEA
jgi:5-methylcytosine-specific restriction protein B